MKTFFMQIKCEIGRTYDVSDNLVNMDLASEIYSTAGRFDIIAKFHVDDNVEIGEFVNNLLRKLDGIRDCETLVAFKAFL